MLVIKSVFHIPPRLLNDRDCATHFTMSADRICVITPGLLFTSIVYQIVWVYWVCAHPSSDQRHTMFYGSTAIYACYYRLCTRWNVYWVCIFIYYIVYTYLCSCEWVAPHSFMCHYRTHTYGIWLHKQMAAIGNKLYWFIAKWWFSLNASIYVYIYIPAAFFFFFVVNAAATWINPNMGNVRVEFLVFNSLSFS